MSTKLKIVQIESTNLCNSRCTFCPYDKMKRKKGIMSLNLFKKIIDQIKYWNIEELNFTGFGEPLLDPNIAKKIEYARKNLPNCILELFTNSYLLNEKKFKELILAGLDDIIISCYVTNKEEFIKVHGYDGFNQVFNNISRLRKIKKSMNSKLPIISMNFLSFSEKNKWIDFWQQYVERPFCKEVHNFAYGKKYNKVDRGKRLSCFFPFNVLEILWNGDIRICCADYDGKVIYGNVNETPVSEIINSDKYKEIINIHKKGQFNKISICDNCDQLIPGNLRNKLGRMKYNLINKLSKPKNYRERISTRLKYRINR